MIRRPLLLLLNFSLCINCELSKAQVPGEWVWLNGDSTSYYGVFGTQGVPDPLNHPPALYEPCEWTDHSGNFWLFGGDAVYADLWKYDPLTNEWTWIKGPGVNMFSGSYGVLGVPGINNNPPSTGHGAYTWIDDSDNLWLYGGETVLGGSSDLWKYDIATNEWTWMKGHMIFYEPSIFGTQLVADTGNTPGYRSEVSASWADNNGSLWLYGGFSMDAISGWGLRDDLWKFNIATNSWTWMKGSSALEHSPVYGTRMVEDSANNPGRRQVYCRWKDADGNFWLFGGAYLDPDHGVVSYNDLWRYNILTNNWTWMNGDSVVESPGSYLQQCTSSQFIKPAGRFENRVAWTDKYGDLWMFGGVSNSGIWNDLWKYCISSNSWVWIIGNNFLNASGFWGIKGVSSPLNIPDGRGGAIGWTNHDNQLYFFGGTGGNGGFHCDVWRFTIDTTCGVCSAILPVAQVSIPDNSICPGTCVSIDNLSGMSTSYQWFFPGAHPDTSTAMNPSNICYANPGTYDFTLIAINANGGDTLTMQNYITVFPTPPPQAIAQSGDTLFALAGSSTYQWYFNANIINAATNYFYTATQSGNYSVVATDSNGCEVEAVINNVIANNSQLAIGSWQLAIFPNPVMDKLTIQKSQITRGTAIELSVYNVLGEKVYTAEFSSSSNSEPITINCEDFPTGTYSLEIISNEKIYRTKFLKQ